jgi:hypothetical protein
LPLLSRLGLRGELSGGLRGGPFHTIGWHEDKEGVGIEGIEGINSDGINSNEINSNEEVRIICFRGWAKGGWMKRLGVLSTYSTNYRRAGEGVKPRVYRKGSAQGPCRV